MHVTFKKTQGLQKHCHCAGLLKCAFFFFFFSPYLSSLFLILLLHICKVQSSNLISSASVQLLALICNCATSLQGENLGRHSRRNAEGHFHGSGFSVGLYTLGLEKVAESPRGIGFFSFVYLIFFRDGAGWLVDLRLDSQKGPLDIFMVFLALFTKEGGGGSGLPHPNSLRLCP